MLRALYHALLPAPIRARIRTMQRTTALRRAFAHLRRDLDAALADGATFEQLVYGWDNAGWSANADYLRRVAQHMSTLRGATIVECGSGLSTLVLGVAAERTGSRVISLEHTPAWRERVRAELARAGVTCVDVVDAPLVDYGAFDWYRVDASLRARRIELVVCDGPPGTTRGGRYGLLPVMRDALADECVVLLDDAHRDDERRVLAQWQAEFGGSAWTPPHAEGTKAYAEYRVGPATRDPPRVAGRSDERRQSERS